MGVVGKLLGKLNAFDPKRDGFAGAVTDESEQTKLGAFLFVGFSGEAAVFGKGAVRAHVDAKRALKFPPNRA